MRTEPCVEFAPCTAGFRCDHDATLTRHNMKGAQQLAPPGLRARIVADARWFSVPGMQRLMIPALSARSSMCTSSKPASAARARRVSTVAAPAMRLAQPELDVGRGHAPRVRAGLRDHLGRRVDADDAALDAHPPRREEAVEPGAASEVDDDFTASVSEYPVARLPPCCDPQRPTPQLSAPSATFV